MEENKPLHILSILTKLWVFRRLLMLFGLAGVGVGLLLAFTSPKEWSSYTALIPENNRSTVGLGSLGGLAGLAGVKIPGNDSGIPVELYGNIVMSTPVMAKLLESEFYFTSIDQELDLFTYMEDQMKTSLFGSIMKYSKDLLNRSEEENKLIDFVLMADTVISLSRSEELIVEELRARITVDVDKKTSVVTIACRFQDPNVSAQITASLINQLSEFLADYYRDKALRKVTFIQGQVAEKITDFENKQAALATFRDSNKNLSTDFALRELRNLEAKVDLAFNVLSSLQQQYEEARIEYEENTPFLNILEPPRVPNIRASPNRKLITAATIMLFVFIGCGWVFIRNYKEFIPG